ncbi:hypothetical protein LCGC14_2582640 [marine sediment metagenome]|uniref:Uncharacterized protein n=1 Tax=marine sediment metagenome TaxID=412755 RepID=A0A0F9D6S6_9ZZZZ
MTDKPKFKIGDIVWYLTECDIGQDFSFRHMKITELSTKGDINWCPGEIYYWGIINYAGGECLKFTRPKVEDELFENLSELLKVIEEYVASVEESCQIIDQAIVKRIATEGNPNFKKGEPIWRLIKESNFLGYEPITVHKIYMKSFGTVYLYKSGHRNESSYNMPEVSEKECFKTEEEVCKKIKEIAEEMNER